METTQDTAELMVSVSLDSVNAAATALSLTIVRLQAERAASPTQPDLALIDARLATTRAALVELSAARQLATDPPPAPGENTKHDCGGPVFGKLTPGCPRCDELLGGAPARDGWQKDYYDRKAKDEADLLAAIKAHRCTPESCGPVCTKFDW